MQITKRCANGHHTLVFNINETSVDKVNNKSIVSWSIQLIADSGWGFSTIGSTLSATIDGASVYNQYAQRSCNGGSTVTWASGTKEIQHSTDGSKSINFSCSYSQGSSSSWTPGNASLNGTLPLTKIARYTSISTFKVDKKDETSVKVTYGTADTIDYLWYSKDNGSTWTALDVADGTSGSFNISGLSANTAYNFKLRVRRKDSQLTTDSSTVSQTTYDYPYCTSSPNFIIGNKVKLDFYNPLSRSFSFYIIANGVTLSNTWQINSTSYSGIDGDTIISQLYQSMPNTKNATYQVKCVYGTSTKTRNNGNTVSVKGTEIPTFSNFSFKDSNESVVAVTGNNQILVKGLSNLIATISTDNKMVANYYASPKSYSVTIDNITKSANYSANDLNIDIGAISSSGAKRLNITAIDSRTLSKVVYKDITVLDYTKPVINVEISRLNNFEDETTLKVNGTYSRLIIDSADKNTIKKVQYRYRETNGTFSDWHDFEITINENKYTCKDIILSLDNTKSFDFEIQTIDNLQTQTISKSVGVGQAIFFISTNKKACYIYNKEVVTNDKMTAAISTAITNAIATAKTELKKAMFPVGSVYITATNTNPQTFLGGTWIQFGQGRTLVGVNTSDTDFKSALKTGGSKTVTLTPEQMPAHTHTGIKFSDKHLRLGNGGSGTTNTDMVIRYAFEGSNVERNNVVVNAAGGDKSHSNVQPYITVYFWRRTA